MLKVRHVRGWEWGGMGRVCLALGLVVAGLVGGAVRGVEWAGVLPGPEVYLPADTLAVVTVPDMGRWDAATQGLALRRLWGDPAMKPFRDRLEVSWRTEVLEPLERELGVRVWDCLELVHGQWTFAWIRDGWEGRAGQRSSWLMVMDARERGGKLEVMLKGARSRWLASGRGIRRELLQGVAFDVVEVSSGDLAGLFKAGTNAVSGAAVSGGTNAVPAVGGVVGTNGVRSVWIGQVGSVLVAGSSGRVLDRVLARLGGVGGGEAVLGATADFRGDREVLSGSGVGYGWLHVTPLVAMLNRELRERGGDGVEGKGEPGMREAVKAVDALGLGGVKTAVVVVEADGRGPVGRLYLGVPEAGRKGIFRVLTPEKLDSLPPAFVGVDVLQAVRWRVDLPRVWSTLESALLSISPEFGGVLQMTFNVLGKDADSGFDFRRQVIPNLGTDLVLVERMDRVGGLRDLGNPPKLLLWGTPKPDLLVRGIRALGSLAPTGGDPLSQKEWTTNGHVLRTMVLESAEGVTNRAVTFGRVGESVAISGSPGVVEAYALSVTNGVVGVVGGGRALRTDPAFLAAVERVRGGDGGLLGYRNAAVSMRLFFDVVRVNPGEVERVWDQVRVPSRLAGVEGGRPLKEWVDFSLLPPYEAVSKYFGFTVFAGRSTKDGLMWTWHAPTPEGLGK